ncbi:MAG: Uma2 family endonuclease [Candidatus Contendobacter sp.]|nr:Uma2 family endonuclease [Candidatus Contendobacter sp.]MDG4557752.1 Uma2 family endonuclease [Candidatus Contendobacter sp.]
MSQLAEQFITAADYLALERQAETKSEYLNGRIYAMSGASRNHNRITVNLTSALHSRLKRKPCEPFSGDMRIKVSPTGLYTYPDVVVVCGEPRFEDQQVDTLLNPTVIIEVLSDSTAAYDRGEKFAHYRALPSLSDYLLVAQDQPRIEHYQRQPDGRWLYSATDGLDAQVEISTIGCMLQLAEVYERVVFAEPESEPASS